MQHIIWMYVCNTCSECTCATHALNVRVQHIIWMCVCNTLSEWTYATHYLNGRMQHTQNILWPPCSVNQTLNYEKQKVCNEDLHTNMFLWLMGRNACVLSTSFRTAVSSCSITIAWHVQFPPNFDTSFPAHSLHWILIYKTKLLQMESVAQWHTWIRLEKLNTWKPKSFSLLKSLDTFLCTTQESCDLPLQPSYPGILLQPGKIVQADLWLYTDRLYYPAISFSRLQSITINLLTSSSMRSVTVYLTFTFFLNGNMVSLNMSYSYLCSKRLHWQQTFTNQNKKYTNVSVNLGLQQGAEQDPAVFIAF